MNEEKLKLVMAAVLNVDPKQIDESTSKDTISSWDSLKHMNLILALEEEFGVSIPDEDAANLSSYKLIRLVVGELVV